MSCMASWTEFCPQACRVRTHFRVRSSGEVYEDDTDDVVLDACNDHFVLGTGFHGPGNERG